LKDLTALTCPTPSISTSLDVFTPNSQIQICTFFLYYFCTLNYDIYIYSTTVDYSCLHCWFYNYNNFLIKPVHRSPILSGSRSSSVIDLTHSVHEIRPLRFGWSTDALWPDQSYSLHVYMLWQPYTQIAGLSKAVQTYMMTSIMLEQLKTEHSAVLT
jgi:hypothetical protein